MANQSGFDQHNRVQDSDQEPAGQLVNGQLTLRSADLFAGRRQLLIEHEGEFYSLRITSKGKLILTK